MRACPLHAPIPSGRVLSVAAAATALCQRSAPPCWASWTAWPGMLLPETRRLFPALIFMQGGPPMFADVLTHGPCLRHSGLPLIREALQAPFRHPQCREKSCRIYSCRQSSCRASAWRAAFAYWQGATSACPRGCGGFSEPGSVAPCLLFYPQIREAFMLTIPLSRPAYCGGVPSLSFPVLTVREVRHG